MEITISLKTRKLAIKEIKFESRISNIPVLSSLETARCLLIRDYVAAWLGKSKQARQRVLKNQF